MRLIQRGHDSQHFACRRGFRPDATSSGVRLRALAAVFQRDQEVLRSDTVAWMHVDRSSPESIATVRMFISAAARITRMEISERLAIGSDLMGVCVMRCEAQLWEKRGRPCTAKRAWPAGRVVRTAEGELSARDAPPTRNVHDGRGSAAGETRRALFDEGAHRFLVILCLGGSHHRGRF